MTLDEFSSREVGVDVTAVGTKQVVEGPKVIRKIYQNLVPIMFLIGFATYVDRTSLSFAATQLQTDLHLDNSQYGSAAGTLFIGYIIFQLPSQWVIVRVGGHLWLAVLVMLWGTIAACTAAVHTLGQLRLARFLLGAAEAGCFPGIWYHMMLHLSQEEMNFAYSLVLSSTIVSRVLGAPLAAALLMMDGVLGLCGWQWLFLVEGLLTLSIGPVVLFGLARSPESARCLQPCEREWLAARQRAERRKGDEQGQTVGEWWAPFVSWRLWYLAAAATVVATTMYGVLFFAPLIIESVIYGPFDPAAQPASKSTEHAEAWHGAKLALISAVLYIPAAISLAAIGYSAQRFHERNMHCGISELAAGICFMCVPVAMEKQGGMAGMVLLACAAVGTWGCWGVVNSWPAVFLHCSGRATGFGMFSSIVSSGGVVGPLLVGLISNRGSYQHAVITLGACNLVGGLLLLAFRPGKELIEQAREDHQEQDTHSLHPQHVCLSSAAARTV